MARKKAKKEFKGVVTSPFKLRGVSYKIGDIYIADSEDSLKLLILKNRVK